MPPGNPVGAFPGKLFLSSWRKGWSVRELCAVARVQLPAAFAPRCLVSSVWDLTMLRRHRFAASSPRCVLLLAAAAAASASVAVGGLAPAVASAEGASPRAHVPPRAALGDAPVVELAILLDTSNSMDGLIDQARAQLWGIVNRVASKTRGGQVPRLRVALYEYGNSAIPVEAGYVRLVQPLTSDLDAFSQALFELTTNGGDEHCGEAIGRAVEELDWSKGSVTGQGFRAIYIAGNEPFTQGNLSYSLACAAAVGKGVRVNTIHCGPEQVGAETGWREGARLAEGDFLNINQDAAVVRVPTPMDDRLAVLSSELNETFVFFGGERDAFAANQALQDSNALKLGSAVAAERAATKAGSGYRNDADLVTRANAAAAPAQAIAEVPAAALPEEMRSMSEEEKLAHITRLGERRASLEKQIQALNVERTTYLAQREAEAKAEAGEGAEGDTFGSAIRSSVDRQLREAGFEGA